MKMDLKHSITPKEQEALWEKYEKEAPDGMGFVEWMKTQGWEENNPGCYDFICYQHLEWNS